MAPANDDLILRDAVPADAQRVGEIWHAGWRDGHIGHVPDELVAARTPESFPQRAAQRVAGTRVAEIAGDVAGFTMVVDDEIEQIYVAHAHRGSGVSARLMSDAVSRIRADGYDRAWLAVVAGNLRARRFYAKQGWSDAGPFEYGAAGPDGPIAVPCHRYELPLTALG